VDTHRESVGDRRFSSDLGYVGAACDSLSLASSFSNEQRESHDFNMQLDLCPPALSTSTFHPGAQLSHPSPDPGGAATSNAGDLSNGHFVESNQQFHENYNRILSHVSSSISFPVSASCSPASVSGFPTTQPLYISSSDTIRQSYQCPPLEAWSHGTREDPFSNDNSAIRENSNVFMDLWTAREYQVSVSLS
jgi:hypothetical protein